MGEHVKSGGPHGFPVEHGPHTVLQGMHGEQPARIFNVGGAVL